MLHLAICPLLLMQYLLGDCHAARSSSNMPDIIIITANSNNQPQDQQKGPSPQSPPPDPHHQMPHPAPHMFPPHVLPPMRRMHGPHLFPVSQIPHPGLALPLAPPHEANFLSGSQPALAAMTSLVLRDMIESSEKRAMMQHPDSSSGEQHADSSATASDQQLMIEDPSEESPENAVDRWRGERQAVASRNPFLHASRSGTGSRDAEQLLGLLVRGFLREKLMRQLMSHHQQQHQQQQQDRDLEASSSSTFSPDMESDLSIPDSMFSLMSGDRSKSMATRETFDLGSEQEQMTFGNRDLISRSFGLLRPRNINDMLLSSSDHIHRQVYNDSRLEFGNNNTTPSVGNKN